MEYSIIVPVYNVEKYIHRCIDSILNQTFQDFELILIDDGSPDNSGEICDEYAKKDTRIKVIHQKNAGVSSARNKGIEIAKGEYLVFVDSDDEVLPDYIESMNRSESDLVISGVKNIASNGEIHHVLKYNTCERQLCLDVIAEMIENKAINFIYAKRYRTDLIKKKNLTFDLNIDLGEDTLFCVKYLCLCKEIEYKDNASYLYYKYDSVTLSSFNSDYVKKLEKANRGILNLLKDKYPDMQETLAWQKRCWSVYYYSIFYILREWDAPIRTRVGLLQEIFKNVEYRKLEKRIDIFMNDDSKLIRKILRLKNGYLVFICWKILELKRK